MSKELRFPNINAIIASCRLTKEPELRYTQGGTAVCSASAAINRSYKKGEEWVEETSFVDLIVWGAAGQRFAEQGYKGAPVIAEGYLRVRDWESDKGKGRAVEIVASRVSILEKQITR
jgi:single-strand DNA-binding protein